MQTVPSAGKNALAIISLKLPCIVPDESESTMDPYLNLLQSSLLFTQTSAIQINFRLPIHAWFRAK